MFTQNPRWSRLESCWGAGYLARIRGDSGRLMRRRTVSGSASARPSGGGRRAGGRLCSRNKNAQKRPETPGMQRKTEKDTLLPTNRLALELDHQHLFGRVSGVCS